MQANPRMLKNASTLEISVWSNMCRGSIPGSIYIHTYVEDTVNIMCGGHRGAPNTEILFIMGQSLAHRATSKVSSKKKKIQFRCSLPD